MTDPEGTAPHGRVGADGTVYVVTSSGERRVGQWPGGDPEAALAFYVNRYVGLTAEVHLLEQRVASHALTPAQAGKAVDRLRSAVAEAAAVGDLDALLRRLDQLTPALEQARETRRVERAAAAVKTAAARKNIVEKVEAVAAGTDWNTGPAKLRDLIEQWKALGRIDKATDDALWQRLSAARTTYTRRRRQHFAELDEKRRSAAATKEKLIAEAEALADSTDWSGTARTFRDLMARWKTAGSARREAEEALWGRFRAAQDAFFTARDAQTAQTDATHTANADVKRALLTEAEALLPVRDPRAAREAFRAIGARWDAAGKVPRQDLKTLEARLARVDGDIRRAEDDRWRRSNPEGSARAAATVTQLEATIAAARERLAAAEERGDDADAGQARADIAARESWLAQVTKALEEFGG